MPKHHSDHDVYIAETAPGNFKVFPPVALVNGSATFMNMTGYTVTINIDGGNWVGGANGTLTSGTNATFNFVGTGRKGKCSSYQVSVDPGGLVAIPAEGNSDPKIIVD